MGWHDQGRGRVVGGVKVGKAAVDVLAVEHHLLSLSICQGAAVDALFCRSDVQQWALCALLLLLLAFTPCSITWLTVSFRPS